MDSIGKSLGRNVSQMEGRLALSLTLSELDATAGEVSSKMFISSRQNRQWSYADGRTSLISGVRSE